MVHFYGALVYVTGWGNLESAVLNYGNMVHALVK